MPEFTKPSTKSSLAWSRETGFTVDGWPIDPTTADSLIAVAAIRKHVTELKERAAEWRPGIRDIYRKGARRG